NKYFLKLLIKKKVRMLNSSQKIKSQGGLVVCDRFPQMTIWGISDGLVHHKERKSLSGNHELDFLNQTIHFDSDMVFNLIGSPDTAIIEEPLHNNSRLVKKYKLNEQISFS